MIETTEELALLAIDKLGDQLAYGTNVTRMINRVSRIKYSHSIIYRVINRLFASGMINIVPINITPDGRRHGRMPVKSYVVTSSGRQALALVDEVRKSLQVQRI